jgi:hypothetical protein
MQRSLEGSFKRTACTLAAYLISEGMLAHIRQPGFRSLMLLALNAAWAAESSFGGVVVRVATAE